MKEHLIKNERENNSDSKSGQQQHRFPFPSKDFGLNRWKKDRREYGGEKSVALFTASSSS